MKPVSLAMPATLGKTQPGTTRPIARRIVGRLATVCLFLRCVAVAIWEHGVLGGKK
jgi:hypothetical protein